MSFASTTLRPGLLVGLSTSIKGNVQYVKKVIEEDHYTGDGARKAKWETERTVIDPVEHEAATKARSKARSIVASVCAASAFGFLCPEDNTLELEKALADARKVCDDFNAGAKLTRLYFYAITGRIAPDDVAAVRAINAEVRGFLSDMEEGIKNLDVEMVRGAAKRAKELGSMLTPDAQARIQIAIDAARATATKINAAGEQAAVEIDQRTLRALSEARTAFLDLDEAGEIGVPSPEGRAIDLAPEGKAVNSPAPKSPELEIG